MHYRIPACVKLSREMPCTATFSALLNCMKPTMYDDTHRLITERSNPLENITNSLACSTQANSERTCQHAPCPRQIAGTSNHCNTASTSSTLARAPILQMRGVVAFSTSSTPLRMSSCVSVRLEIESIIPFVSFHRHPIFVSSCGQDREARRFCLHI